MNCPFKQCASKQLPFALMPTLTPFNDTRGLKINCFIEIFFEIPATRNQFNNGKFGEFLLNVIIYRFSIFLSE